jgi:hypothetical protein
VAVGGGWNVVGGVRRSNGGVSDISEGRERDSNEVDTYAKLNAD